MATLTSRRTFLLGVVIVLFLFNAMNQLGKLDGDGISRLRPRQPSPTFRSPPFSQARPDAKEHLRAQSELQTLEVQTQAALQHTASPSPSLSPSSADNDDARHNDKEIEIGKEKEKNNIVAPNRSPLPELFSEGERERRRRPDVGGGEGRSEEEEQKQTIEQEEPASFSEEKADGIIEPRLPATSLPSFGAFVNREVTIKKHREWNQSCDALRRELDRSSAATTRNTATATTASISQTKADWNYSEKDRARRRGLVGATNDPLVVRDDGHHHRDAVFWESCNGYCVVHFHGFHHTGTGLLWTLGATAFGHSDNVATSGGVSRFHDTHASQDEGQHLQTVYPNFRKRADDRSVCHQLYPYICPPLMKTVGAENQRLLWKQWSKHWSKDDTHRRPKKHEKATKDPPSSSSLPHPTNHILLQKTPTFDIQYLDAMLPGSSHVISMRHPLFHWMSPVSYFDDREYTHALFALRRWLKVWRSVFVLLRKRENERDRERETKTTNDEIDRYTIYRYEDVITESHNYQIEIHDWLIERCPFAVTAYFSSLPGSEGKTKRKRMLNIRGKAQIDTSHLWDGRDGRHWRKIDRCYSKPSCFSTLTSLEPLFLKHFGYSLLDPRNKTMYRKFIYSEEGRDREGEEERDKERAWKVRMGEMAIFTDARPPTEELMKDIGIMIDLIDVNGSKEKAQKL